MLAFIPPHTIFGVLVLLVVLGFFVYRMLMRTGKSTRTFDMDERTTKTADEIFSDIEGSKNELDRKKRSLEEERHLRDQEIERIQKHHDS